MNRGLVVAAAALALGLLAASPACSHLDLTGEDYACTTAADCLAGRACTDGLCRAGGADGGLADGGDVLAADAGTPPDACSASCWAKGVKMSSVEPCLCLGNAYCADAFACGDNGQCTCGARKGDVPPDGRCKYNSQCGDGFCSPWAHGGQCARNCAGDGDCSPAQPRCFSIDNWVGGVAPRFCVTPDFDERCLQNPPCAGGVGDCTARTSDDCSPGYRFEQVDNVGTCVCGKRGGAEFGSAVMAPPDCTSGVAFTSPMNPNQLLCTVDCARGCRAPLPICNTQGYCGN